MRGTDHQQSQCNPPAAELTQQGCIGRAACRTAANQHADHRKPPSLLPTAGLSKTQRKSCSWLRQNAELGCRSTILHSSRVTVRPGQSTIVHLRVLIATNLIKMHVAARLLSSHLTAHKRSLGTPTSRDAECSAPQIGAVAGVEDRLDRSRGGRSL